MRYCGRELIKVDRLNVNIAQVKDPKKTKFEQMKQENLSKLFEGEDSINFIVVIR